MKRALVLSLSIVSGLALGCAATKPLPDRSTAVAPSGVGAAFAPPAAPAPAKFGGEVVKVASPSMPVVSFRIAFQAGSIDDPKGKEGLTALTARLMADGGTEELTSAQLLERFFPMAAGIGVELGKELTVFEGQVHRDHVEAYLPLLAAALTRPRWDPKELERLREDSIQGIEKGLRSSDDEELGKQALTGLLWNGHPYGHFELGTVTGLKAITLEDAQAQAKRVFTRDRMLVGVAGPVDDALVERLQAALVGLPEKGAPLVALPAPASAGPKVLLVEKDSGSTAISMGYPYALRRGHPDYYPMMVAVSALGEHRQFIGRLMKELRVKRGLNYGDYAYVEHFEQAGWGTYPAVNIGRRQQEFTIWLRPVAAENGLFAIRGALWTAQRLVEEGITQEELETVRGFLRGYTLLWEQTPMRRLGYAIDDRFYGTEGHLAGFRDALETMTVEEVNAAIRRWLRPEELRIVAVVKDAEGLRRAMAANAPSTIAYAAEAVDEALLADDARFSRLELGLSPEQVEIVPVERLFE